MGRRSSGGSIFLPASPSLPPPRRHFPLLYSLTIGRPQWPNPDPERGMAPAIESGPETYGECPCAY